MKNSKPRLTVGVIGHQGHGKSTLTQALLDHARRQGYQTRDSRMPPYIPRQRPYNGPEDITILPADDAPLQLKLGDL